MPSLFELGAKYIWGTTKNESVIASDVPENTPPSELTSEMLRNIALSEPLILKTFLKKNKDIYRNWHTIKTKNGKGEVNPEVIRLLRNFDKTQQIKKKIFTAGFCADVYGTGFIEKLFSERKNANPSNPPHGKALFTGIKLLNPEFITDIEYHPDRKDGLLYFVYFNPNDTKNTEKVYINPSRIRTYITNELPFSHFGISKVKTASNILRSKMNADKSAGNILNFMAGMYDIEIDGMTKDQEKKAKSTVKKHPSYLIHNQDFKVKVEKPGKVEPASFYDYFYTNIAAVGEMPKHVLTGSESVEGSEVGYSSYVADCGDIQDVIATPILEELYTDYLKGFNIKWDFEIDWNPIFVDELSEAKILQTRAYSATQGYLAGILKSLEARQIFNEGTVHLIGDYEKPPEQKVSDPNIQPAGDPKKPQKGKESIKYITKKQIGLMEKYRKLGMDILEEQNADSENVS